MVFAINGLLVTAIVFGPAALAMLYARELNKRLRKEMLEAREVISGVVNLKIEAFNKILDKLEDADEEKSILYGRIDRLEAKHKSGGKELAKRAVKLKAKIQKSGDSGMWHESRTLAPQPKDPKDMVFHMTNTKKKARKTRSK